MRKRALSLCVFILALVVSSVAYCDYATPLATHVKNIKRLYAAKDYESVINESCNALYHGRQESFSYYYLAKSYEKSGKLIPAIISYMKYAQANDRTKKRKVDDKIRFLKTKVDNKKLQAAIRKGAKQVLIKESYYKKNKLFKVQDYIYNPMGQIIQEFLSQAGSGCESKTIYTYDEDGNLKEKIRSKNNKVIESETFSYKDGRVVFTVTTGPNGKMVKKIGYKYDMNGNIKKIMTYNGKEALVFKKSFLYNNDKIYEETSSDYLKPSSKDNYTATYKYKAGKLIAKEVNLTMGFFEKVKYRYLKGDLKEELFYNENEIPIKSKKYSYTRDGKVKGVSIYTIWKRKKFVLTSKISYQYAKI